MNSRYDSIRNINADTTRLKVQYRIREDLSQIGGPSTVLRVFDKEYALGSYIPSVAASEIEAFMNELQERADVIAEKHGFMTVVKVD